MPGMRRAKRRQQDRTRRKLSQRFFGDDGIGMAYGTTTDGIPALVFVLSCLADDLCAYAGRLAAATLRLSYNGEFLVLDAIVEDASIGRLATTLGGDALPLVFAHLDALGGDVLQIDLASINAPLDDAQSLTLPIEVVPAKSAEPEFVEVGTGPHVVCTTDVHTGVTCVHRFQTAEAARAQSQRNRDADLPFVGLVAS